MTNKKKTAAKPEAAAGEALVPVSFGPFTVAPYGAVSGKAAALVHPKGSVPEFRNEEVMCLLAYAASGNLAALLQGDTGTGKTSAVRYLSSLAGAPYRRINLSGGTTVDDLIGRTELADGKTFWVDGVLTEAVREGWWLVLDELNAASPEVMFVLQSLLDDDRFLVLPGNGGEIVRADPRFRLFATMNPSDGYAGTRDPNRALISRFPVAAYVDYPSAADEEAILVSRTGVAADDAKKIVKVAAGMRKAYREQKGDLCLSTRDALAWAAACVAFRDPMAAMRATLGVKGSADDRAALEASAKLQFGGYGRAFKTPKELATYVAEETKHRAGCYLRFTKSARLAGRVFGAGCEVHAAGVVEAVSGLAQTSLFIVTPHLAESGASLGRTWNVVLNADAAAALTTCGKAAGFDESEIRH